MGKRCGGQRLCPPGTPTPHHRSCPAIRAAPPASDSHSSRLRAHHRCRSLEITTISCRQQWDEPFADGQGQGTGILMRGWGCPSGGWGQVPTASAPAPWVKAACSTSAQGAPSPCPLLPTHHCVSQNLCGHSLTDRVLGVEVAVSRTKPPQEVAQAASLDLRVRWSPPRQLAVRLFGPGLCSQLAIQILFQACFACGAPSKKEPHPFLSLLGHFHSLRPPLKLRLAVTQLFPDIVTPKFLQSLPAVG